MVVLRVKGSSQNATFAKEEEEEARVWMYKKGWRSWIGPNQYPLSKTKATNFLPLCGLFTGRVGLREECGFW